MAEFRNRSSANEFKDRRFGEYSRSLTEEQKMLERFKRERNNSRLLGKRSRNAKFNLDEEDEEEREKRPRSALDDALAADAAFMRLTHRGRPLEEIDDLEGEVLPYASDDEGPAEGEEDERE